MCVCVSYRIIPRFSRCTAKWLTNYDSNPLIGKWSLPCMHGMNGKNYRFLKSLRDGRVFRIIFHVEYGRQCDRIKKPSVFFDYRTRTTSRPDYPQCISCKCIWSIVERVVASERVPVVIPHSARSLLTKSFSGLCDAHRQWNAQKTSSCCKISRFTESRKKCITAPGKCSFRAVDGCIK